MGKELSRLAVKMVVCEEMCKLRKYLLDEAIGYKDFSEEIDDRYFIHRTHFWIGNFGFMVINGVGSCGGADLSGNNKGLLEVWKDWENVPTGNQTCLDVMQLIAIYKHKVKNGETI